MFSSCARVCLCGECDVCVCVWVVIDFGFIASSRAVLYLGPNQSVSLTTSRDLPAGGVCVSVCVSVCLSVGVSERERVWVCMRESEREKQSLKGGCRRLCWTERPSGSRFNPSFQFQCPRLSLTGQSRWSSVLQHTPPQVHTHTSTHRHTHAQTMELWWSVTASYGQIKMSQLHWCTGGKSKCHAELLHTHTYHTRPNRTKLLNGGK